MHSLGRSLERVSSALRGAASPSVLPRIATPIQGYAAIALIWAGAAIRWGPEVGMLAGGALLLLDAWRPPRLTLPLGRRRLRGKVPVPGPRDLEALAREQRL